MISQQQANLFVLGKQHLTPGSRLEDVVRVAGDIGGLHATGATTPYLSLWARCPGFTRARLEVELYERHTLARLRSVRGTIYIYPREFLPVAFAATSASVIALSRRYMEASGVTFEQYQRVSQDVLRLLAGREMTAVAIRQALQIDAYVPTVLNLMCDQGLLLRARPDKGWRDAHHRYARFSEYLPGVDLKQYSAGEASVEIVRQYLRSFGPAGEHDMAWWTGFTRSRVRTALHELGGKVTEIELRGTERPWWLLSEEVEPLRQTRPAGAPTVNLLPGLDPYLMGYRERARWLDEARAPWVFDRAGNATNVILVDGRAAGVWDVAPTGEPGVKVFLFEDPPRQVLDTIQAEARQLGRFILERDVSVRQVREMVPLPQRNAGGFMSPLREA